MQYLTHVIFDFKNYAIYLCALLYKYIFAEKKSMAFTNYYSCAQMKNYAQHQRKIVLKSTKYRHNKKVITKISKANYPPLPHASITNYDKHIIDILTDFADFLFMRTCITHVSSEYIPARVKDYMKILQRRNFNKQI